MHHKWPPVGRGPNDSASQNHQIHWGIDSLTLSLTPTDWFALRAYSLPLLRLPQRTRAVLHRLQHPSGSYFGTITDAHKGSRRFMLHLELPELTSSPQRLLLLRDLPQVLQDLQSLLRFDLPHLSVSHLDLGVEIPCSSPAKVQKALGRIHLPNCWTGEIIEGTLYFRSGGPGRSRPSGAVLRAIPSWRRRGPERGLTSRPIRLGATVGAAY